MKISKQVGHQGDTQWYSIDSIPANAKKIEKSFLAKSEQSGSVHALCGNYDLYELEDGFCVDVKEDCVLNHTFSSNVTEKTINAPVELIPKDHRSSVIRKGQYFVGIQRRYNPFEKQWKKVVD